VSVDLIEVFTVYENTNTSASVRVLREAWIIFLRPWPWEGFCTFTLQETTHPEATYKRFRLLLSMINRDLYRPRWCEEGAR